METGVLLPNDEFKSDPQRFKAGGMRQALKDNMLEYYWFSDESFILTPFWITTTFLLIFAEFAYVMVIIRKNDAAQDAKQKNYPRHPGQHTSIAL